MSGLGELMRAMANSPTVVEDLVRRGYNPDLCVYPEYPDGLSLEMLLEMFADPATPRNKLMHALMLAWCHHAQTPLRTLPQEQWTAMFRRVGYFDLVHVMATPLPDTVRLYRGAWAEYARGMSWTPHARDAAQVAAGRHGGLWTVDAPKSAILAVFQPMGFLEYVVDVPDDVPVERGYL